MNQISRCKAKHHSDLAHEWDQLAEERHRQIISGEDLSFDHVVAPMALNLLRDTNTSLVLDIGSGTGEFTARLARVATRVIGVEPSRTSIAVAAAGCLELENVEFIHASFEDAGTVLRTRPVTAAVACMTLMTTPNLNDFADTLAAVLPNASTFVATFTHPCFWPRYWGYESEAWFTYAEEIFIEAPFVISRHRSSLKTTHVHRPLELYLNVLTGAGFRLEELVEPVPSASVQALYPAPWDFPRFIGMRWRRAS